jgi:phenylalanine-4-hydroxylase
MTAVGEAGDEVGRRGRVTTVSLTDDHPGFADPVYRQRRDEIAAASAALGRDAEPPRIDYRPDEVDLWATVSAALDERHERYACAEYRAAAARLALPRDRVPQLADVSARLAGLTGFRISAVPGLVPTDVFYGSLADRRFLSTQYLRHGSEPFYTPEPDVIHELIGHANGLASPAFAALYEAAGRASRRATTPDDLERFSRVFWFTMEFGVVREDGELRAYGAGLLSSFGEIEAFRDAEVRGWDPDEMASRDYDITHFQPVLYCAGDFATTAQLALDFFRSFAT